MKIVIVGNGKKLAFLVESLLGNRHSVTVINNDKKECIDLSHTFEEISVIHGDGSKSFILEDAEVGGADLMIAITNTDADNLVICQLAKKKFGIKRAFATVNDPTNQYVFKRLGINTVISATRVLAEIIEQMASVHEIVNYLPMENGKLQLMEFNVSPENSMCGKKIADINIPENAIIGCIVHNGKVIIPNGRTKISAGDKLTVLTVAEAKKKIVDLFSGS